MKTRRTLSLIVLALLACMSVQAQTSFSWMSPEVGDAWREGYKGSGVTITVIDDFKSTRGLRGNLGDGLKSLRHGEWTLKEASMIAPAATMRARDFNTSKTVDLNRGLNVLNLSYGMFAPAGYTADQIGWKAQESSVINYAQNGQAVISKAAGNDSIPIGTVNKAGNVDYLSVALKGAQSAIFVGALTTNGTTIAPASLASYSNMPGVDATVQRQFVVVGVEGHKTGLYGTSFAAPIISGYSAILGSKFTQASPPKIATQLLNTARQDTISNYNLATHGRGEASIFRALSPVTIQ
jgi:subtilisin family serine protease